MGAELLDDWAGWLVAMTSFVWPLLIQEPRRNSKVKFALYCVLILHHAVAYTNAYIATVLGASTDAVRFHRQASEFVWYGLDFRLLVGSGFYGQLLGLFYSMFGVSLFFGQQLSILAFLVSCFFFLKLIKLLGFHQYSTSLLWVYGALPSMIMFGSVTLRESYEILFFILSVYYALRFHYLGKIQLYMLSCFYAMAMGLFHNGLVIYAIFLIGTIIFWTMRSSKKINLYSISKRKVVGFFFGLVALGVLVAFIYSGDSAKGSSAALALSEGDAVEYIENYRDNGIERNARATYGIVLDTSSLYTIALTMTPVWVSYMFSPFPWQISSSLDLYASLESIFRLILIMCSIITWRKAVGEQKRIFGMLLFLYFSMSLLWSLGTTNYGTAIRHHVVNYWIIVILGWPVIVEYGRWLFSTPARHFRIIKPWS